MKRLRTLAVSCAIFLLLAGRAFGQVQKEMVEANITGKFARQTWSTDRWSDSGSILQLEILAGNFATDKLEVGPIFSIMGSFDDAIGDLSGFMSYHFPKSADTKNAPYVGGRFGTGFGYDDNPITWGGYAGLKTFVAAGGGAFSIQGYYTRQHFDAGSRSEYGVENGVSIFF